MLTLKIGVVVTVALIGIILGGMAAAWRRACVAITRRVHTVNFLRGDGSGSERPDAPGPGMLSSTDVIRFTPQWVSARHLLALAFLALTLLAATLCFRWYVALGITLTTYVLMELAGFVFPARDHPYYVRQLEDSFSMTLATARHFGDQDSASDMHERLRELTCAYPGVVGQGKSVDKQPDTML